MNKQTRGVAAADLLSLDQYSVKRKQLRKQMLEIQN